MAMTEGQETLKKCSLSSLEKSVDDEELRALLIPDFNDLPSIPRSAVESNFVRYYAVDLLKPAHDQYIYRHANGLCVIGLAPSHAALNEVGGVQSVDFNVGKSNRSELKVTGKRKRNAQHLQPDSALCNVCANGTYYTARCCVKGSLLEVNDRLIKNPELLNLAADREGYIAIIMPKPTDWLKVKDSFLSYEDYKKLRHQVSERGYLPAATFESPKALGGVTNRSADLEEAPTPN
ncbi:hypothetical protein M5K25_000044 [Dendrobium thyrsiflorum]|uniref:Actin-binding transcription modulator n=1 Tax=Dendrobium thyrsiflorum TaxID=117978 RepID=A0ABD0VUD0_DENTH